MVKIRLSRGGARKKPYYHIVVMDQRQKRDGRCLERIGSYDPNIESSDRISLNMERLEYWVSKGAQLSNRVSLLKKYSIDTDNTSKRKAIKQAQLEKSKQKRLKKKEEATEQTAAPEAPAEEAAAPEAPAEEAAAPEAPAEEAAAPEAPAEEAAAPEAPAEEKKDK